MSNAERQRHYRRRQRARRRDLEKDWDRRTDLLLLRSAAPARAETGRAQAATAARDRAGVVGFRFHDHRHDFATKLLRETGNLRLVQKALGHASIKTTTRYAHVLDSEVADAMERVAARRKKPAARLKVV
jgi:site-specific recombinase XerD